MNNEIHRALNDSAPLPLQELENDKRGPLGIFRPWAWFVEPVRGCNLRCSFCATRLFPKDERHFMSMETWKQSLEIIKEVTPKCRIEFCNAGEPTLHPQLIDFISLARTQVPQSQILLYTNGTMILKGVVKYKALFEAGLNMVFVDMYSSREQHIEVAKKSSYEFFEKINIKKEGRTNVFSYRNDPNIHLIQLSEHPGDWSKQKVSSCGFSTFLNHLDWEAAAKYGIKPVIKAPYRRCQQVFSYANICYDGEYVFCCFDFMRETAGLLGNVSDGVNGFLKFWFSKYMQETRRKLRVKDRAGHEKCNRCSFAANRCDIPRWQPEALNHWYNGNSWEKLSGLTMEEIEKAIQKNTGLGLPSPKIKKARRENT
jgi:organic radical activating enzyme